MKFCKSTLALAFLLAVVTDIAAQDLKQAPSPPPCLNVALDLRRIL